MPHTFFYGLTPNTGRAESGQMRLHPMVTAFDAGWAAGT
ncbi:hypothetical protein ATPR_0848 [Acetobacter tropicalis NBRC 101654]|uniref:Uncharacterized protein n=1 Tax=Acetobacter tropicalis NBRC 101654 TaxID=749388 RepID=F7VBU9_9PROT|nr:hypothetical protein ATPR_0848 [Acetobacter tropicalis NBRC 101654]